MNLINRWRAAVCASPPFGVTMTQPFLMEPNPPNEMMFCGFLLRLENRNHEGNEQL